MGHVPVLARLIEKVMERVRVVMSSAKIFNRPPPFLDSFSLVLVVTPLGDHKGTC